MNFTVKVRRVVTAAPTVATAAILALSVVCIPAARAQQPEAGTGAPPPPKTVTLAAPVAPAPIAVYSQPDAGAPERMLDAIRRWGAPTTLLVTENRNEWLKVLLPVRPNGSSGWVRTRDMRLSGTNMAVDVSLDTRTLTAFRDGNVLLTAPVAIGKPENPTPTGLFTVTELLQPPTPNGPYGKYAFGLSGYSPNLTSFNGGDGQIGLHGTNDPAKLGQAISSGCIRVSNDVITQLADLLPLGVPVQVH